MSARLAILMALAVPVAFGCGDRAPAPEEPAPREPEPEARDEDEDEGGDEEVSGLRLQVTPADAEVFIDGLPYGPASELDPVVELSPGLHQIWIEREGYRTWRAEIAVGASTQDLEVELPEASPP